MKYERFRFVGAPIVEPPWPDPTDLYPDAKDLRILRGALGWLMAEELHYRDEPSPSTLQKYRRVLESVGWQEGMTASDLIAHERRHRR